MLDLDYILDPLRSPADRQAARNAANWLKHWDQVSKGGQVMAEVTLRAIAAAGQPRPPSPQPANPGRYGLIGLHGRNAPTWEPADYALVKAARIETLKMMSETDPAVFRRLREENPHIQFITRLRGGGFGVGHHPTPEEFADQTTPVIGALRPYCQDFEMHNEPAHPEGYEGWWLSDEDALDFSQWFLKVLNILKARHPWARFGFPGLAIPHRDLEWLRLCKVAIGFADWLGVHSYWEYENHRDPFWGRRFEQYREIIPNKIMHITEAGNAQKDLDKATYARQVVEFYETCRGYDYIGSVSFFIMSSPDPTWARFAWRDESGGFKPVVEAVGAMVR